MLRLTTANQNIDLQQILDLQHKNLKAHLSPEELQEEGFVTVHHDLALLSAMNKPYPHVIAKNEDTVVGYVLVMLRKMQEHIPVLIPMFTKINTLGYEGQALIDVPYFIMGQVCIDKHYRGQGLFQRLYKHLRQVMKRDFRYCITEVSKRNPRSIRAHEKVGFKTLFCYTAEDGEVWLILIWTL